MIYWNAIATLNFNNIIQNVGFLNLVSISIIITFFLGTYHLTTSNYESSW